MMRVACLWLLGGAALSAAVLSGSVDTSQLSPHPEYDEVVESELLELAFRARVHADALASAHAEVAAARAGMAGRDSLAAAVEQHRLYGGTSARLTSGATNTAGSTADSQNTMASGSSTSDTAASGSLESAGSKAEVDSHWRFGGNFSPQQYGQWRMSKGAWNFGNDKRMECEACSYVLYMLIDRLGDQFSRVTIDQEAELLCPRVQWVYKSACDFVVRKNKAVIADLIMKLIEPVDICKHLTLCPPDYYDLMGAGSVNGYGSMPSQYRRGDAPIPFAPYAGIQPPPFARPFFDPGTGVGASYNPIGGAYASGYDMYGNHLPQAASMPVAPTSGSTEGAQASKSAAQPAAATSPDAAGGGS